MPRAGYVGILGIGAFILFWAASFLLAALRPGYSHADNALSVLGAMGTPNAVFWNVFGFMIPGILLALVGGTVARSVIREKSAYRAVTTLFLVLSGLAVSAQGVFPAEMTNGVADIGSPYTRAHFVCTLISGPAWAIGVLMLYGPMKRDSTWRGLHTIGVALVVLVLLASVTLHGNRDIETT